MNPIHVIGVDGTPWNEIALGLLRAADTGAEQTESYDKLILAVGAEPFVPPVPGTALPGVFTMNIAIREYGGDILFLHKLVPGPADRSYGVEVARLAGVPAPVVQRARAILAELEQSRGEGRRMSPQTETLALPGMEKRVAREEPPSLPIDIPAAPAAGPHPLVLLLRDLDPEELSPLAALKLIMEWKKLWADAPDTEEKHV